MTHNSIQINGVDIPIIYEKGTLPTFYLELNFIGGGSNYAKKIGVANMSASILNEGSKKLGNEKFAQKLEDRAISLSVGNGLYSLKFALSSLNEYRSDAMSLLKELLYDPNTTQKSLDKLKILAKSSLLAKESDFDYVAQRELNAIQFKGTSLEVSGYGNIKNIENIKLNDVKSHIKDTINLNNLIIVLGGDIDIKSVEKELISLLKDLPKANKKSILPITTSKITKTKTIKKDTEQAYIYFGSPFVVDDFKEQSYKAKVASFILGGSGFGSRLMEEVRVKKGLAYSVSHVIVADKHVSYAQGHLQTKIENSAQAIKILKEVIQDFIKNGATKKELQSAQAFLSGSQPMREESMSQRLNTKFNNYFRGLELDFNKQELAKINSLTLEELNAYIKAHTELNDLSISIVTK